MADGVRRIGIGSRFQRGFRVLTFPPLSLTQLSNGGRWMRFSPFPLSHPGWPLRTDFGPFYPTFFSASLAHSLTLNCVRVQLQRGGATMVCLRLRSFIVLFLSFFVAVVARRSSVRRRRLLCSPIITWMAAAPRRKRKREGGLNWGTTTDHRTGQ